MDNQLIKIDGVELPEYIKFKRAPIWAIIRVSRNLVGISI